MDVLGLLWYVFFSFLFVFCFRGLVCAFLFWVGELGYEREGRGVGVRGG